MILNEEIKKINVKNSVGKREKKCPQKKINYKQI